MKFILILTLFVVSQFAYSNEEPEGFVKKEAFSVFKKWPLSPRKFYPIHIQKKVYKKLKAEQTKVDNK